jgi:hypothetical protein
MKIPTRHRVIVPFRTVKKKGKMAARPLSALFRSLAGNSHEGPTPQMACIGEGGLVATL